MTRQYLANLISATMGEGHGSLGFLSGMISGALIMLIESLLIPSVRYQIQGPTILMCFFTPWVLVAAIGGAFAGLLITPVGVRHAHQRFDFPWQKNITATACGLIGGGLVATLVVRFLPFLLWYSVMSLSR